MVRPRRGDLGAIMGLGSDEGQGVVQRLSWASSDIAPRSANVGELVLLQMNLVIATRSRET